MTKTLLNICSFFLIILLSGCGDSMADKLKNKMGTLTEMSELGTVEYTVTKIIKASDEAFYTIGERKILFSCCATMKAGIDLKDFSAENVKIDSDKEVTVTLPAPKVWRLICPLNRLSWSMRRLVHSVLTLRQRNAISC